MTGQRPRIRGVLAAAVTPLVPDASAVDERAINALVEFYNEAGVDGIFALGTTGEGVMLRPGERETVVETFVAANRGRLTLTVHCGAQTTAETVLLASSAAEAGADAVAVIAPPYYPFDEAGLLGHFESAAAACAPLPFYVYEFADRSGYAVPVSVVLRLREAASNFVGLKVSDAPFERFAPYLIDGLDVLVGPEALILSGLDQGAVGAVSGLASALPEVVVDLVREQDARSAVRVAELRSRLQRFPVPAVFKRVLADRGLPISSAVRAPLRDLSEDEWREARDVCASAAPGTANPGPFSTSAPGYARGG